MADIMLSEQPLDAAALTQQLIAPQYGGIDIFIGTVRQMTGDVETTAIDYTAYRPMALKEMQKLAAPYQAQGFKVVMAHRVGHLELCDLAVFIGVAAPHRAEAFAACRELIDQLKQTVPIWKKEYDTDKIRFGGLED
ncbi:MAG: molybdenum cofactor biosynthesis protein MoaE [Lactobacillus sp.]|jgi:molybdopterin synthase catalytic subunit|nr:molybdenum cofactor biosynthesis protein MoaE [Lactobacillus sp.]MCI2032847.1 molybdenum cofactor biosynthesis protein MoaE [Lactobacillus sp.]